MKRTIALLAACAFAVAGAAQAQGVSAGLRLWQADWDLRSDGETIDMGSDPFVLAFLGIHDGSTSLIGQIGYGQGWDRLGEDVKRLDLALAVLSNFEVFSVGVGGRMMDYEADGGAEWTYVGPELLAGVVVPLEGTPVSLTLSGSVGVYWWEFESGLFEDDGSAFGFTFDAGALATFDAVNLRAGYRLQRIDEDGDFSGDEFKGPYMEVGVLF